MPINQNDKFGLDRNVSSLLAFTLIIILSCAVAWYSVSVASEIVKNSKNSASFNIEKRVKKEVDDKITNQINRQK